MNKDAAEQALDELEVKWGEEYPIVIRSWRENWDRLNAYFRHSPHIRRIIYTTNTVEGYHRQLRKGTKNKGLFTSDDALKKNLFILPLRESERSGFSRSRTGARQRSSWPSSSPTGSGSTNKFKQLLGFSKKNIYFCTPFRERLS